MSGHIANQIKHHDLRSDSTLHVIGVIQNAVRYHSRYRHFRDWAKRMVETPHVELHVVEACYGDRHPELKPEADEYSYHEVRTNSEIWLKENLINIGVKHLLPRDWKYMAWVDCDVQFHRDDWALASVHQLQHYNVIQPWSHAADLNHDGGIIQHYKSFGFLCANGYPMSHVNWKKGYEFAHTGYAWACNRYYYENIEKLLDWCIIGAGDHHMAWSNVGRILETIHGGVCDDYRRTALEFQRKASAACAGLVGYAPGTLLHPFHGPKSRRGYKTRWSILIDNHYNPATDVRYDSQGVLQICGKNRQALEHAVMRYNRERQEDSIEQY